MIKMWNNDDRMQVTPPTWLEDPKRTDLQQVRNLPGGIYAVY